MAALRFDICGQKKGKFYVSMSETRVKAVGECEAGTRGTGLVQACYCR